MADQIEPKMIIPDDVKAELKEFCKNHGMDVNDVKVQFRDLYFGPCGNFPESTGERARQAKNALKAILNMGGGRGENIDGIVYGLTYPQSIVVNKGKEKEKVSQKMNIVGIFMLKNKKGENEKKFTTITVWEDAIDMAKKIPVGKLLKLTSITVKEDDKYGTQMTLNRSSTFRLMKEGDSINSTEYLKKMFKSVTVEVEEAEMKPSRMIETKDGEQRTDKNDRKMVVGRVVDMTIMGSKRGNVFGKYWVSGDDVSDKDLIDNRKASTFSVSCDPAFAKYGPGSLCIFIGAISPPTQTYPASMFADLVYPIMPINKKPEELEAEMKNAQAKAEYMAKNEGETPDRFSKKKKSESNDIEEDSDVGEMTKDMNLKDW